jgi:beta-phosphoglucomutase-like phosphatase (HAD superfamily)
MTQPQIIVLKDFDNTTCLTSLADKIALKQTFGAIIKSIPAASDIDFENDFRGKDIKNICDALNQKYRTDLKESDLRQEFRKIFFENLDQVTFTRGTKDAIKRFQDHGVTQAIASNSPQIRIQTVFNHLQLSYTGGIFSVFDFEPEPKLKPLPDVFVRAAQQSMESNDPCVIYMVDESVTGIKSAVAAKQALLKDNPTHVIHVIGYIGDRLQTNQDPHQAAKDLQECGAEQIFDDMNVFAESVINFNL